MKVLIISLLFSIVGFGFGYGVFAQTALPLVDQSCTGVDCAWANVIATTGNVLRFITLDLAFVLVSILVVIGAFMYMFGGANPGTAEKGKSMMVKALIGYAVVVFAGIFFDLVLQFIGGTLHPPGGP
ncbi:MAG: hypothetical protein M1505_02200 [Patescibacteria group bacterium]|nr:hypothetical protein [Patescibacteria group bacterium]MCL5258013.1 hypothetical protein [Patescibacteria group bacterium]